MAIQKRVGEKPGLPREVLEKRKAVREMVAHATRQAFWKWLSSELVTRAAKELETVKTVAPTGDKAGIVAQAQGRIQVIEWILKLPEQSTKE
jgi:hypothetical protein